MILFLIAFKTDILFFPSKTGSVSKLGDYAKSFETDPKQ